MTEGHLDEMVANFYALNGTNIVKPHLKLGHTDAQKWFGQKVGIPTLGWISRIWREGAKLFADIDSVPEALLDLFRQGRYHNVSSEVFSPGQIEHDGKKFGHVLSAVAILGTEMPAVKDLAGLAAALYGQQFSSETKQEPVIFNQANGVAMFTQEQVDTLIAAAVNKANEAIRAEFATRISDLGAQVTTLTARAEAAEGKLNTQAAEFAQREAVNLVDQAIKDGKLLPKQKDLALAFMSGMKGTVNFGGAEKTPAQLFADFIGLAGKQVDTTERGSGKEGSRDVRQFATAGHEVDAKVNEAISASGGKLGYAEAMKKVLDGDADLASRYIKGE